MKKIVLFLLLTSATFSLSSFGIVTNPRMSKQHAQARKEMNVSSKSDINSNFVFGGVIVKTTPKEAKEESDKNFLKSFFGLIISALSQIVITLVSK